MREKKLLNDLVKDGLLPSTEVLRIRGKDGDYGDVVTLLVQNGLISEEKMVEFFASRYGIPKIDLSTVELTEKVLNLLPVDFLRKRRVVPFDRIGRIIKVAMANPLDLSTIDDIEFITGLEAQVYVAQLSKITSTIDQYFETTEDLQGLLESISGELMEVVEEEEEKVEITDLTQAVEQAPVVRLVNSMIVDAVRKGASDIHLEPGEKSLRVRYRIDGILYEAMQPPFKLKEAIASRIKVMAKLDIAERRLPQDGRIKVRLSDRTIDLRVSTVPITWGEKVVMRILDRGNVQFDLKALGLEEWSLEQVHKALSKPYGMILVTGPTGSGKTTTLYSMLQILNKPEVNIMTVEDPVEYEFPGINQVNVKEEIGLDFARALRAFLRQDPDIIMVGEIRDQETAAIAIRAAITGHLVLSTLHTNDAPSAIVRLVDMGIEPFLVSSSVSVIIAQRLVRKICTNCKEKAEIHPNVLQELNLFPEELENITFYKGSGCSICNNTGYKGRIGVFEVMPVTPEIRAMVLDKAPVDEIREKAIENGMITLRESALRKMLKGVTTAEEVLRVTKDI